MFYKIISTTLKKNHEQVKQFKKMEGVAQITRNLLTKRVQLEIVENDEESIGKEAKRIRIQWLQALQILTSIPQILKITIINKQDLISV